MFCTVCGQPVESTAQFCSACGARVTPSAAYPSLTPSLPPRSSDLTRLTHLVMVSDTLSRIPSFQFQDAYGRPLGGTEVEGLFPVKCRLFDETGQVVLGVDAQRVQGLHYEFRILDPDGAVLATLRVESSFMSRRYGLTVGGRSDWRLTTDAVGHHYQIEEAQGGRALATGDRTSAVGAGTTDIVIVDGQPLDHRIVIGAMILAGIAARG